MLHAEWRASTGTGADETTTTTDAKAGICFQNLPSNVRIQSADTNMPINQPVAGIAANQKGYELCQSVPKADRHGEFISCNKLSVCHLDKVHKEQ